MGVETALIAATALSATSTLASGFQAYQQGEYEQDQARADADAALAAARVQAKNIRRVADRQRSAARAALAASGVSVDMGTGEDIQTEIATAGEQDAVMSILGGRNTARMLQSEGAMAGLRGRQALGGSVLGAAGDAAYGYSRWKRAGA